MDKKIILMVMDGIGLRQLCSSRRRDKTKSRTIEINCLLQAGSGRPEANFKAAQPGGG